MACSVTLHDRIGRERFAAAVDPLAADDALRLLESAAAETTRASLGALDILFRGEAYVTGYELHRGDLYATTEPASPGMVHFIRQHFLGNVTFGGDGLDRYPIGLAQVDRTIPGRQ